MGQQSSVIGEIYQINSVTSTEAFLQSNGISLTFKAVSEHSKAYNYLFNSQVMVKAKVVFGSEESAQYPPSKWFLTEAEFWRVSALLRDASGQPLNQAAIVPDSRECPVCHDRQIEQRFPSCRHGFCSRCITDWLTRSDSCPMCRQPTNGGTVDMRRQRLLTSINLASDSRVRKAIAIICHQDCGPD